jgi:hypothetical protein
MKEMINPAVKHKKAQPSGWARNSLLNRQREFAE